MKITEKQLDIKKILGVIYGKSPKGNIKCNSRHSDCFVYVLSGRGVYNYKGETFVATKGDILYLPYMSSYEKIVECEDFTHIHVDFFFTGDEKRDVCVFNVSPLDTSFKKLVKLWQFGDFADLVECKSILYHIYGRLISASIHSYIPISQKSSVEKAVLMIHESYCNPHISITEIARKAEMSEVHFRRLFKTLYHTSPIKYIQSLKIEKAKSMLTDKALSITEISETCGFRNSYYFARIFKNETEMTPSQYRNQSL